MDGNGRWAKKKGAMRIFGHRNAIQAVRESIKERESWGFNTSPYFRFLQKIGLGPKMKFRH